MARQELLAAALLAAGAPAAAVDFETLVMPGPVIEGHAKVEAECTRCHAPFERSAERGLCLDCHDTVAEDLTAGTGFHGRNPAVADVQCRSCHTDHRGREADIVGLDPARFDHALTDYPLEGAHGRVPCAGCHPVGEKPRQASSDCVGCHRDDDPHRGRLGESCADCHGELAWTEARFDHAKTRFPLEGEHAEVACASCHPGERYENTATDCRSCHSVDDAHRGRFGPRCEECHAPAGWDQLRFDHDRDTDFALEGRHRDAACRACHSGVLFQEETPRDCLSCHRADDAHRGRNGPRCGRCHEAAGWDRSSFDHDETDFPLRGSHREASCERCHRGVAGEEELASTCFGCHAAEDVHDGQEGRDCARCHDETRWAEGVRFDHDLTGFPLLGLHAVVACERCHETPRYRDARSVCSACHVDDFHQGRLGTACSLCHNPNGWDRWRFDHDAQTEFALHGAHADVDCHACHARPVSGRIRLAQDCGSCHARDDVHGGRFGRDCGRCHGEERWSDVSLGR